MPELPEVESYRALAEARGLHRPIAEVRAGDAWYLKGGLEAATVSAVLLGRQFIAARRRGKLLLLDVGSPSPGDRGVEANEAAVLGLRFGMSGRLVVD